MVPRHTELYYGRCYYRLPTLTIFPHTYNPSTYFATEQLKKDFVKKKKTNKLFTKMLAQTIFPLCDIMLFKKILHIQFKWDA